MTVNNNISQHLIRCLERISPDKSMFNYKSGRRPFLLIREGSYHEWLEVLLPNTRIILEPKIIGEKIGLLYINGKLSKAINKNSIDITEFITSLISIPKNIPIKNRIEIEGILYEDGYITKNKNVKESLIFNHSKQNLKSPNFCAYQIFHCNINHFQALQELKNLNFEIPQTHFTKYISDIEIYHHFWKDGMLFQQYPTNGIVLKINSRKLQKQLGENNQSINWAYSIN